MKIDAKAKTRRRNKRMKFKKGMAALLAAAMVLGMTACSPQPKNTATEQGNGTKV